jgi:glycosyltransferase involved in cell wall biosynthesis
MTNSSVTSQVMHSHPANESEWNLRMSVMPADLPLVSAVIPTRDRPDLVCCAVWSALNQTYSNMEVVVVVDGPSRVTVETLESLRDSRLTIIELGESVGGSEARNVGVRKAKGSWIAFLDDDDEWLPEKIEMQVALANTIHGPLAFVACRFVDRDPFGDRVLPVGTRDPTQPFSEFVLCRAGLSGGSGYVQTSTWLVSTKLAQQCPFTPGLKRNQDLDWMLRAMSIPGASFALVNEPLSIFNSPADGARVSKKADWEFHYRWAIDNRQYFTKKALTYFLSTVCLEDAVRQGRRLPAARKLVASIFRYGEASAKSWFFFCYYLILTEKPRHRLRVAIARLKGRRAERTPVRVALVNGRNFSTRQHAAKTSPKSSI